MTISVSPQAYEELFQWEKAEWPQHPDSNDALDVVYKLSSSLGAGY